MTENKFNPDKSPHSTGFTQVLVSIYFWITIFLIPGIFFPVLVLIWAITVIFDNRRTILHKCTCYLSDITLAANPYWKATIRGTEKVDPKAVYVIVSNHQSGADIMVMFKTHIAFKWVAKKSLFYLPFIGWEMWLNRYIPIERTMGRSKLKMMDRSTEAIDLGNSIMLFPEGTRSRDGNIQPFKTGAFRVAQETHVPILPVAIKGTFHAVRKGSFVINRTMNLEAVILDPIPYSVYKNMAPNEIADKVHDLINEEFSK